MAISLRHSVVTRILGLILTITTFFGGITLIYSYYYSKSQVESLSADIVQSLVQTVLPSVQIACFVNDDKLAKELAKGLLSNELISKVSILDSNGSELSDAVKGNLPEAESTLTMESRQVFSPFDKTEPVGEIKVWLNQQQLTLQTRRIWYMAFYPLFIQTLSISFALIIAAWLIMRPKSRQLMEQIASVNIDQGDKLSCPKSERRSEIGVLIAYINRLIERMYNILKNERQLRELQAIEHKRFQSIFDNSQTGIFLANRQAEILSLNRACQQLGIYNENSATASQDFFHNLAPNDIKLRNQIANSFDKLEEFTFEFCLPNKRSQGNRWYQISLTPIDANSIQGVINDVTTFKSESLIAYNMARTDSLTNLGNRMGLDDELSQRLSSERSGQHSLTLMMIDLDRFKQVNDTLGHHAGDEVLTHIANRLRAAVRDIDYVARHGGDEFTILLNDMEPPQSTLIAARLIASLNQKIVLKDGNITSVGASIGIAYVPKGFKIDSREIVKKADEAMYYIKKSGRNDFSLVDVSEISNRQNHQQPH